MDRGKEDGPQRALTCHAERHRQGALDVKTGRLQEQRIPVCYDDPISGASSGSTGKQLRL